MQDGHDTDFVTEGNKLSITDWKYLCTGKYPHKNVSKHYRFCDTIWDLPYHQVVMIENKLRVNRV